MASVLLHGGPCDMLVVEVEEFVVEYAHDIEVEVLYRHGDYVIIERTYLYRPIKDGDYHWRYYGLIRERKTRG